MDKAAFQAGLGPATRDLLARDAAAYMRQSGSTPCVSAVRRAEGVWLEDADGRPIMDFHGNSTHHIGYAHPFLLAALTRQLTELTFAPRRFTCAPAVELAEKLAALWPGGEARVLLATGGSDAVEIALKAARVATGRRKFLAFYDAYHGSGLGALSVSGRKIDRPARLGPLLEGVLHVPPYYRPGAVHAGEDERLARDCLAAVRYTLEREGDVAALIAEPLKNTPHVPPAWFWPEVRAACDAHGTLLIFDEIPTGLGKTGRLFASEHWAVRPDITVLGKALGGGVVPIAATILHASLDVAPELALGHYTHEKNPFTATAALTTLAIIEDERLVANAGRQGERALARLRDFAERHPSVRAARGIGLLLAVVLRDGSGRDAATRAGSVAYRCLQAGLNLTDGEGGTLCMTPPLVISDEEMDWALDVLDAALTADA
ncbi:MAG: aminotransferase class III-fold pyridoxal phosphate-dependent enzyme [Acetobacteraceae bacterium]